MNWLKSITAVILFLFLVGCGDELQPVKTYLPRNYPATNSEGRLTLIATIQNGKVTKVTVGQSLADTLLMEAAKNSLLSWEFREKNSGTYKVTFVFRTLWPPAREFRYKNQPFKTEFDPQTHTITITNTRVPIA